VPWNGSVGPVPEPSDRDVGRAADNSLLTNCVIFHTALDMTEVIRQLIAVKADSMRRWAAAPMAGAANPGPVGMVIDVTLSSYMSS
jgi:hypothetical protein